MPFQAICSVPLEQVATDGTHEDKAQPVRTWAIPSAVFRLSFVCTFLRRITADAAIS